MAAQPFSMPVVSVKVTDSGAGSPRTTAFAARTARMYLASVSGGTPGRNGGTEADPDEWIRGHLQRALNNNDALSLWVCALQADGRLRITYNGTGTGQITWDGTGGTSLLPRYLAGFDADVSLGAGASVTGTYQVTHAAFVVSGRASSEGWQVLPPRAAIGEQDDGLSYAFRASIGRQVYTADWRFAPLDWATRQANALNGTPYQPTRFYRRTRQSATLYTTGTVAGDAADTTHAVSDPPWSLVDFFGSTHGNRVAVAIGNFEGMIAATDTEGFYTGSLARETLLGERKAGPSQPDNSMRYDWRGVTLRLVGKGAR